MLPFVLAAVGGYLIGHSKEQKYAKGGMTDSDYKKKILKYRNKLVQMNVGKDEPALDFSIKVIDMLLDGELVINKMADSDYKKMAKGGKVYSDEEIYEMIHEKKAPKTKPYFTLSKSDFAKAKDMGFEYDENEDGWVSMKSWNDAPYDDDDTICSACNGSGEGMSDGSICRKCGGSGVEERKKEYDGDDRDYDDTDYATEWGGLDMAKGGSITMMVDKTIKLYYHKTNGGAEYLCSKKVRGTKDEGDLKSDICVRIDDAKTQGGELKMGDEKMKLYHHKTSGGAQYLSSSKVRGTKDEGDSDSKYVVRIDGAKKYGGELMIKVPIK